MRVVHREVTKEENEKLLIPTNAIADEIKEILTRYNTTLSIVAFTLPSGESRLIRQGDRLQIIRVLEGLKEAELYEMKAEGSRENPN